MSSNTIIRRLEALERAIIARPGPRTSQSASSRWSLKAAISSWSVGRWTMRMAALKRNYARQTRRSVLVSAVGSLPAAVFYKPAGQAQLILRQRPKCDDYDLLAHVYHGLPARCVGG
jgi:hypothetical protein